MKKVIKMKKLTTGDRIKDRRKMLGASASSIAETLGINVASYYKYENNTTKKIPVEILNEIARLLKCTPEFLTGNELNYDKRVMQLFIQLNKEDQERTIRQMENKIKSYALSPFNFKAARKKNKADEKNALPPLNNIEDIDIENTQGVTDIKDL